MASNETGWTKEYPSLAHGSRFWLRHAPDAEPELHQLTGGRGWMESFGIVRDTTEFLGPVTASDAEQLIQLRKAGTRMLEVFETYKERHLVPAYLVNALADLRDALAGVDRAVTVQCADCLTWFDKNANHTCRQQVRRNQRSRR